MRRGVVLVLLGMVSSAAGQSGPATSRPSEPEARQVFQELLRPVPTASEPLAARRDVVIDATSGAAAIVPGAPAVKLVREGTYVTNRVGRLSREGDGSVQFVFETDGRSLLQPPMIVLPNLKLMDMESALKAASRDLRFNVTGMVTEYGGRNYLLIEKAVVVPEIKQ